MCLLYCFGENGFEFFYRVFVGECGNDVVEG